MGTILNLLAKTNKDLSFFYPVCYPQAQPGFFIYKQLKTKL